MPFDWGTPERNPTLRVGYSGRPLGDVEACHSVSVGLIATFYASEVDVDSPVSLADVSASWAGLRCVAWLYFHHEDAFPLGYMFQGVVEEDVEDVRLTVAGKVFKPNPSKVLALNI